MADNRSRTEPTDPSTVQPTEQDPAVQPAELTTEQHAALVSPPAPEPTPTDPDLERQLPPSGPAPALEAYRQEKIQEYAGFVAVTKIYVGNALAYNVGDPVPVSNVRRFGYDQQELVRPAGESTS